MKLRPSHFLAGLTVAAFGLAVAALWLGVREWFAYNVVSALGFAAMTGVTAAAERKESR